MVLLAAGIVLVLVIALIVIRTVVHILRFIFDNTYRFEHRSRSTYQRPTAWINNRMNPANPNSPLNPMNPANPNSPLNPMNPASPRNRMNPANPNARNIPGNPMYRSPFKK